MDAASLPPNVQDIEQIRYAVTLFICSSKLLWDENTNANTHVVKKLPLA